MTDHTPPTPPAQPPDDHAADLAAAIDRLAETVRTLSAKPAAHRSDPGAGIELDADKVRSKATVAEGSPAAPTAEPQWNRVGEVLGVAVARILDYHLRAATARRPDASTPAAAVGSAKQRLSRLGQFGRWVGRTRAARHAKAAAQKFGGTSAGRSITKAAVWPFHPFKRRADDGAGRGESKAAHAGDAAARLTGRVVGTVGGAVVGAAVGGPVGARVGAFVGGQVGSEVGGEAMKTARKVYEFGKHAEEASRKLAEMNHAIGKMSGLLNQVETEGELRDQQRSRETGDRLAPSAHTRMESEQALKDNMKEQQLLAARLDNYLQSIENQLATIVNWPIEKIARLLNRLFPGDDATSSTLGEMAEKLAKKYDDDEREAKARMEKAGKQ